MDARSVNIVSSASRAVERDLQRLRETSGKVVGSFFFGTLLKTMRESTLKGPFGHGGRGEEVFAGQLHGLLAERMGEAMNQGPQEALYRSLARQQGLLTKRREAELGRDAIDPRLDAPGSAPDAIRRSVQGSVPRP